MSLVPSLRAESSAGDIVLLHHGRMIERADAAEFFHSPRTVEARSFIAGDLLL
jgi:tungstate transport system ATP-binding protein